MSKFNELVTKLREIFQIDRPELDFGVYRILNARADEINDYLENRLKEKVSAALSAKAKGDTESITKDLIAELRDEYGKRAFDDDGNLVDEEALASETGRRLQDILNSSKGVADNENAVFSHLLTFFSRYYDQGDFISQRRYKGDTYAIPYAGEEVMLHWANKDQYYIKSGENFSNYSFKLEDGRVVHFRLVAADTAKDNRKDNDKDRLFVLAENRTIVRIDDEGDEYDDEIIPIEETATTDADGNATTELIIRFDYKAVSKGTKQDKLISEAVSSTLELNWVSSNWPELASRAPTEKNPKRTLLEKHLINYTAKNTADYFIHKNLGKFLRGELDFYIKNEVMNLDDVQDAEAFSDIEKNLRMIQCLRSIASDLITFLAQLEDFQKKLWNKNKIVVNKELCISLSHIDERFYEEISRNNQQWNQWISFGFITEIGSVSTLIENQGLIIDTANFSSDFKQRLISSINNINEITNGVLINSDNYQAIKFISGKWSRKIDMIYIDPPYNTVDAGFIYKNSFKDSSWLSLIESRVSLSKKLLAHNGLFACAIDDYEFSNLQKNLDDIFGVENRLGNLVVEIKPSGRTNDNYLATSHEYIVFYHTGDDRPSINFFALTDRQISDYSGELNGKAFKWRDFLRTGGFSTPEERPNSYYPIYYDPDSGKASLDKFTNAIEILPLDSSGQKRVWRKTRPSFLTHLESGEINFKANKDGVWKVQIIDYMKEGTRPKSVWIGSKYDASSHGTKLLQKMFGGNSGFSFPKSINSVFDTLYLHLSDKINSVVLDYFSGSGTTAHALMNLNRIDSGNRSFILVEQGQYFDNVTKPRVLKAAFSSEWNSGKPVENDSLNVCFEVIKLESYEDSLNNLTNENSKLQTDLLMSNPQLRDDYLIRYSLKFQADCILTLEQFRSPFDVRMNIATDSSGAIANCKIDLIETFNYLLGLSVTAYEFQIEKGFARIEGCLPSGEQALILWRDCEKIGYEKLREWENRLNIGAKDNPYDVIYINGDHNLSEIYSPTKEEGGETSVRVIRSIEPEFLSRMFAEEEI